MAPLCLRAAFRSKEIGSVPCSARFADMFQGFEERQIATRDSSIHARIGGTGPPLLFLHGFPETHLMWRDVAPRLARDFTIICADLRGQGDSSCLESDKQHNPYSKRAMAGELVEAMGRLGFERFAVAGHDRGGRVAYRMAFDHPDSVERLAVLDVVPIADAWRLADSRLTLSFWPWSLLAQPAPLPERLISASPEAVIEDAASQWGTRSSCFPAEIREAYAEALRDPCRVHAICEEFRAAATLDRQHDEADRSSGRRIECPLLVLWDGHGALENWYGGQGGPIGIWQAWASDVRGKAVAGGHFFPEACPEATAEELGAFFHDD
jgi:haloacetate dehalogenase